MRAFADALDSVPMALAENSGLSPIETLANIKSRQAKEKNTRLGVDCMQTGSNGKLAFPPAQHFDIDHTYSALPFPLPMASRGSAYFLLFSSLLAMRYTSTSAWLRDPVVHPLPAF